MFIVSIIYHNLTIKYGNYLDLTGYIFFMMIVYEICFSFIINLYSFICGGQILFMTFLSTSKSWFKSASVLWLFLSSLNLLLYLFHRPRGPLKKIYLITLWIFCILSPLEWNIFFTYIHYKFLCIIFLQKEHGSSTEN